MAEEKAERPKSTNVQVKLTNVRLSFPDLWKARAAQKDAEPKFGAAFLIDKETQGDQIKSLREATAKVAHEKWGGKLPKGLKYCVHEGSEREYEGYGEENVYVTASSKRRPHVIDRNREPLTEEDARPYAGCFVNAVLRFWAQDNAFGKRVNAELQGVQFVRDGEAFGSAPFKPEEHFEDLGGNGGSGEPDPNEDEIPF